MKLEDLNNILLNFAEAADLCNSRLLQGNERHAVWMRSRNLVAGLAATTSVAGRPINIRIGLPQNFPYELPVIRLDDAETFPHIPHLEEDGAICFIVPRGLVIDRHSPLGILRDALERALETLRQGWQGENVTDEFMDEFAAYWRSTRPNEHVASFLQVGGDVRKVHLEMAPQAKSGTLLNSEIRNRASRTAGSPQRLHTRQTSPAVAKEWREKQVKRQQALHRNAMQLHAAEPVRPTPRGLGSIFDLPGEPADFHQRPQARGGRHALYVPLPDQTRLQPPRPGHRWSANDVHQLVRRSLLPEGLRQLDALTQKCGDELLVILGLPRPSGGTTLIGLRYFGLKGVHPLGSSSDVRHLRDPEPVGVTRLDRELISGRGGASTNLTSRKVLLIGCGSVGGHIAMMLTSTGVGELTLLDGDLLAPENIFRHVLGRKALGQLKVKALVNEIQERSSYIRVRGIPMMLDGAVREKQVDLSAYDLIISATGEPVVDLDLNARLVALREEGGKPAAIHTWLEPFGIGGHAVLSIGENGCFECLYTPDEDGQGPLHNRAALYAPVDEQPRDFNLDLVGCGSFYAPYSDLDARRTAELAVRLALSALQGTQTESILKSWKGDASDFQKQGFRLARRYAQTSDALLEGVTYASTLCRTCVNRIPREDAV